MTYDPQSTSDYIASLTANLAKIAKDAKLDALSYLLSMSQMEAELQSRNRTDRKRAP